MKMNNVSEVQILIVDAGAQYGKVCFYLNLFINKYIFFKCKFLLTYII